MDPRKQAKHDENEEAASDIERQHQETERPDRLQAVPADGEGHGAERSNRRSSHQHAERGEQHVGKGFEPFDDQASCASDVGDAEPEDDRKKQNRKDLTVCEGAEERVRNNVKKELRKAHCSCSFGELLHH